MEGGGAGWGDIGWQNTNGETHYLDKDADMTTRALEQRIRPIGIRLVVREGAERRAARAHGGRDGRHQGRRVRVEGRELGVQERPLRVRRHPDAGHGLEAADRLLRGRVGAVPGVADA